MSERVCEKCKGPVPAYNDASVLDEIMNRTATFKTTPTEPCHLLPITENGVTVCEGSPSRAQYLEGQPRDTRRTYNYQPRHEARFRNAYAILLAENPPDSPGIQITPAILAVIVAVLILLFLVLSSYHNRAKLLKPVATSSSSSLR